jgi:DNA-binding Lrp family transcriptional regulator
MYLAEISIAEKVLSLTERRKPISFDDLDYRIVCELNQQGRLAASTIASKVGADVRTVRNRIARLIQSNAIRIKAIANPQAFGYQTLVDIFIEVEPNAEATLVKRLLSMPEVAFLAYGPGSGEISIEGYFKDNAEMRNFLVHVLPSMPGIKSYRYTLVPQVLKNIDEWLPRSEDFLRQSG